MSFVPLQPDRICILTDYLLFQLFRPVKIWQVRKERRYNSNWRSRHRKNGRTCAPRKDSVVSTNETLNRTGLHQVIYNWINCLKLVNIILTDYNHIVFVFFLFEKVSPLLEDEVSYRETDKLLFEVFTQMFVLEYPMGNKKQNKWIPHWNSWSCIENIGETLC